MAAELALVQARRIAAAAASAKLQLQRDKNSFFLFLVSMVSVFASAIGRASASVAMNMVYTLSCELWPTEVRAVGMSAGSMAARVGGAMSPVLLWALQDWSPVSSYVVFGLLSLCGACALLLLPETRGAGTLESAADLHALIEAQELLRRRRGESGWVERPASHWSCGAGDPCNGREEEYDYDDGEPLLS